MADYQGAVYRDQGGNKITVESGGEIEIKSGGVLDVQAGATYTNAGPFTHRVRSDVFNFDNGAGATIDNIVMKATAAITVRAARIVYTEATNAAGVTAGNAKIGTTAAGGEIVAATAYEQPKSIGSETAMTVAVGAVAAGAAVYVRHTGVVATPIAGQGFVEIEYTVDP